MNTNNIINNILGARPKADKRSKNSQNPYTERTGPEWDTTQLSYKGYDIEIVPMASGFEAWIRNGNINIEVLKSTTKTGAISYAKEFIDINLQ